MVVEEMEVLVEEVELVVIELAVVKGVFVEVAGE